MISRPAPTKYPLFADTYVRLVPDGSDPIAQLREQPAQLAAMLSELTDDQGIFSYAPGKRTIKEALVHLIDTERIFAYRALRIGRGDQTPLPGFEQDNYVPASGANDRALTDIWREYNAVRTATLALFDSFTDAAIARIGTAGGGPLSVRALTYIIPGHEAHHIAILQKHYLPGLV